MVYEISILNIDKGAIEEGIVEKRMSQFSNAGLNLLLTAEPYFYKKALLLPDQHFVLGFDTFIRLLDLKYYDHSVDKLCEIMTMLDHSNTRFLVGGRLNPQTHLFEKLGDHSNIIQKQFVHMFEGIEEFRVDLSSTEIRSRGTV